MALLFFDGFDHYATADMASKWTFAGGTITNASKRNGINGLHQPSTAGVTLTAASGATFIVGAAIKFATLAANLTLFACTDGQGTTGNFQTGVQLNGDGTLSVRVGGLGGTLIAGPSAWVATTGVWYYIECKVVISDTVGTVEVRVDGTPILNVTGVDTKFTSTATWNGLYINNSVADYDDLYVCDGSGALNNNFLGDCIAEALIAQTDAVAAGSNSGLTPSTGTDHGALVDDATPNGDTDYNSGTAASLKDTYNLPSMTSTGAVKGVQVLTYARKADQATKTVCPVLRHAGVDYDGTTVNIPVTYSYLRQVYETNPGTSVAFTGADVNSLQSGMKVVA